MTTEAVTPYTLASQLGRLIFSELFPDDPEADRKSQGRRNDIPAELRIPDVTTSGDVEADDILVVIDDAAYAELSLRTARDVVMNQPHTRLVRVIAKSSKSLKVQDVDLNRGNWRTNLTEFGKSYGYTETRLMLSSSNREIGRLGTVTELREKLLNHPRFAEWQAAYDAAQELHEADEAAAKAAREAKEARQAPVRAAIQQLNALAGEPLVVLWSNEPKGAPGAAEWLGENDFRRVGVYLAGLNAMGEVSDDDHAQARAALAVIADATKKQA
jgi:hypothetical protein